MKIQLDHPTKRIIPQLEFASPFLSDLENASIELALPRQSKFTRCLTREERDPRDLGPVFSLTSVTVSGVGWTFDRRSPWLRGFDLQEAWHHQETDSKSSNEHDGGTGVGLK